jgi:Flp pilus assembly protein TadD
MVLVQRLVVIAGFALTAALAGCSTTDVAVPYAPVASSPPGAPEDGAATIVGMGDRAMAAGDSETAVRLYGRAAQIAGDDPAVLGRLGEAYLAARRWAEAAEVFRRVLVGHPADDQAQRGYARAMLALDQPEAAVAHLEPVVSAAPDDVQALNALGVAYDMLGRHDEAQQAYRAGLARSPGDPSLRTNLGLSQALAGDHAAAVATLEPLANGPGSTPRARQNLALAYGLAGDALAAERIGLLDLDPASVRSNEAFFMALREMDNSGAAAAVLLADPSPQPEVLPGIEIVRTRPGSIDLPVPGATAARAAGMPTPLEPDDTAFAGRERDLPTTPAAIALDAAEMTAGLAPIGSWLIDLGSYDSPASTAAAWRKLRRDNADLLGGMTRLAGSGGGRQSLLAGPIVSEAEADRLCRELASRGVECGKLKI